MLTSFTVADEKILYNSFLMASRSVSLWEGVNLMTPCNSPPSSAAGSTSAGEGFVLAWLADGINYSYVWDKVNKPEWRPHEKFIAGVSTSPTVLLFIGRPRPRPPPHSRPPGPPQPTPNTSRLQPPPFALALRIVLALALPAFIDPLYPTAPT